MRFAAIDTAYEHAEGKPVHSFAGPEYVKQPRYDGNDDGDLRD